MTSSWVYPSVAPLSSGELRSCNDGISLTLGNHMVRTKWADSRLRQHAIHVRISCTHSPARIRVGQRPPMMRQTKALLARWAGLYKRVYCSYRVNPINRRGRKLCGAHWRNACKQNHISKPQCNSVPDLQISLTKGMQQNEKRPVFDVRRKLGMSNPITFYSLQNVWLFLLIS